MNQTPRLGQQERELPSALLAPGPILPRAPSFLWETLQGFWGPHTLEIWCNEFFFPCLAQLCSGVRSRALDPSASAHSEHPRCLPGWRSGGQGGGGGQGMPLPGTGLRRCRLLTSCGSFCCLVMRRYFFEIVLSCFSPHYHSNVDFT